MVACTALQERPSIKVIHSPLSTETGEVKSLKVTAGIKGKKSPSAKTVITVMTPDLIRVEVYGAMHRLVMVVTGDEHNCEYFNDGVVKECEWENESFDSELGYLPNPKILVPFLLNTNNKSPLSIEVGEGGALRFKLSASDYLDVGFGGGLEVPVNIKIESPMETLTIKYRSLELNPVVGESTFTLSTKAAL